MKGKDSDGQNISSPGGQETQGLCGSPNYRYGRPANEREEFLASQKQQILARFGQNLPGFGFTQSKNSCLFEEEEEQPVNCYSNYSYRHGNQLEYMGGPYGYVDPLFSHQLTRPSSVRLEELDVVQHRQRPEFVRQDPPATLLVLPTFVRSAESLVVLSKEHRVDGSNASAFQDRRLNGND